MKKGIKKSLSLIIPAHNAEKVIKESIKKYTEAFTEIFDKFEIIVICNDCWDSTPEICYALEPYYPLKTIKIPQRGKGYALMKGFNESKYKIKGFLAADNPFDLEKITKMINHLDNNCSVVIVSKYLKGKSRKQDFILRRIISLGGSFFSKFFLGLNYRDTQAGAKFFNDDVWKKISNNLDPKYGFTCLGFDWDIEFLYKLKKLKLKIAEVYIPTNSERFSTFRLKYLPGMVKRLLILRFLKKFP